MNSAYFVLTGLTIACFAQLPVLSKSLSSNFLRPNGLTWINYGPAVIHSSRYIVFVDFEDSTSRFNRFVISEKDANFGKVKSLISDRFENLLNESPVEPSFSVRPRGFLYLYAGKILSGEEKQENGGLLMGQQGNLSKKLRSLYLMGVPLDNEMTREHYVEDCKKLRSWMHLDREAQDPRGKPVSIEGLLKLERDKMLRENP